MRALRFLLSYAIFTLFGITLALFVAQNSQSEDLAFFGLSFSVRVGVVVVGAAAFGFLLALLVALPGRIAAALHRRFLDREAAQLEKRVEMLYEQREQLLAQHEVMLEEHAKMLVQYRRLLADHSQTVAERDSVRTALAAVSGPRGEERITRPPISTAMTQPGTATSVSITPPPAGEARDSQNGASPDPQRPSAPFEGRPYALSTQG